MTASPDDEEWHQLVDEYLQGSAEFGLTSPENGGRSYVREGQNSSKRGRVDPLGMPEANGMSASASESESRLIKEFGLPNALPPTSKKQKSGVASRLQLKRMGLVINLALVNFICMMNPGSNANHIPVVKHFMNLWKQLCHHIIFL
ncbi:uncharacterized protein PGTG_00075 [Puccinia graminis f. sp. tritici CRL 75-36-700-3]|uniref:Uncharacterized protein n=1 Tax=Puccinia graminis f. sp. tritici (strain CRL 75-36-700-3 / race SCCL) TaxID=418459 RepID=E3JQ36_PUCGT|nr:uncharacterized protein PGTG_00075 [Puccinia graminis f. sp. tritici CRL 75-36-700-3]EFP74119.1 hypothetical protein PGTG_00075 [Puccinia graminis f. sp. tritici CRL 75-36-700-3]